MGQQTTKVQTLASSTCVFHVGELEGLVSKKCDNMVEDLVLGRFYLKPV
jgi:hypothetical protein